MNPSAASKVREFYESSAEAYAEMMDSEIGLPVYEDLLGRLAERLVDLPGALVDTSCGSGHMLQKYHDDFDANRSLIGVDLSPEMSRIAASRLGSNAGVLTGDMRNLTAVKTGTAVAILSFFAIHHLDPGEVMTALNEWNRVLGPGGQLVLAAWEGAGPIDYGGSSDMVALRYPEKQVFDWVQSCGFDVTRIVVEPVDDFPMDAVYVEATKA